MLTPVVLGSLSIPATAQPNAPALFNSLAGQTVEATLEATLPEGLLLRLTDGKLLQAQGSLPFPEGSLLTLATVPLPEGAGLRLQVVRATPPSSPALLSPLAHGEAGPLLARLQTTGAQSSLAELLRSLIQAGQAVAEGPEAWSSWMRAAMKSLADPAANPAESAFHRLQAKEDTGWFELPLPWAPGAEPMRIWIERDREAAGSGAETVHRVFLSVPFSALGDVRMGLEQRSSGLRIRLWLQDPAQLAAFRSSLEAELATLGRPVDLQLFALPPGTPDLRALAGGSTLQALG
jgi:hypothetical protein